MGLLVGGVGVRVEEGVEAEAGDVFLSVLLAMRARPSKVVAKARDRPGEEGPEEKILARGTTTTGVTPLAVGKLFRLHCSI